MKGVIPPPRSTCTACAHATIMDRPTKRTIHCGLVKGYVPPDILRCSDFIPQGQAHPTWGGDVYPKGLVLDVRPEAGQYG